MRNPNKNPGNPNKKIKIIIFKQIREIQIKKSPISKQKTIK
jgi:hypothetical protein